MKTIFFIRHAKSSWEDLTLADAERPLNKRGLRDAPFMAKLLRGKYQSVDHIISSPAVRAYTTAKYFAEEFDKKPEDIEVVSFIYHSYEQQILDYIPQLDNNLKTVCIFGHNPTFTGLANHFSEEYIANVPTCGIIKIEAEVDNWKSFNQKNAKLVAFHYPKQYF